MKKVSVIVPVYNGETYLSGCVESILNQSYDNIQLILVDDGSHDRCGALCDEFAKKDARVQVVHKANGGVSNARNAGLEFVEGEYVTFCDADDRYDPAWIESLVFEMDLQKADIVLGNYLQMFEDGSYGNRSNHQTGLLECRTSDDLMEYCIHTILGHLHGWECCLRLYRTDILKENNIFFCETCENYAEDMCFTLEYMLYTKRIVSLDFAGYLYMQHNSSMMHRSKNVVKLNSLNEVAMQFAKRFTQVYGPKDVKKYLPILYYAVMATEYQKLIYCRERAPLKEYFKSIKHISEWRRSAVRVFGCMKTLNKLYGKYVTRTILVFSYCFLTFDDRMFAFWCNRMTDS